MMLSPSSTHEVTVAEFQAFRKQHQHDIKFAADTNCPVHDVSWYDAVAFCNWLSDQEGLTRCYEPNTESEYAAGVRIPEDIFQRNGYRLPTAVEWECFCRAGTITLTPLVMRFNCLAITPGTKTIPRIAFGRWAANCQMHGGRLIPTAVSGSGHRICSELPIEPRTVIAVDGDAQTAVRGSIRQSRFSSPVRRTTCAFSARVQIQLRFSPGPNAAASRGQVIRLPRQNCPWCETTRSKSGRPWARPSTPERLKNSLTPWLGTLCRESVIGD